MSNLSVDYAQLDAAAARLGAGREDITARLGELQSLIAALVTGGFVTDRSSHAFQRCYDEFTGGARAAISGLDGLAGYLRQTASTLAEVDAQLAARLAR